MTPTQVARHYFALSNARDLESIEPLLAPEIEYHSDRTGSFSGKAEVIEMMQGFFARFPSIHWLIEACQELPPNRVQIQFQCQSVDLDGEQSTRHGLETITVKHDLIQKIEVASLG